MEGENLKDAARVVMRICEGEAPVIKQEIEGEVLTFSQMLDLDVSKYEHIVDLVGFYHPNPTGLKVELATSTEAICRGVKGELFQKIFRNEETIFFSGPSDPSNPFPLSESGVDIFSFIYFAMKGIGDGKLPLSGNNGMWFKNMEELARVSGNSYPLIFLGYFNLCAGNLNKSREYFSRVPECLNNPLVNLFAQAFIVIVDMSLLKENPLSITREIIEKLEKSLEGIEREDLANVAAGGSGLDAMDVSCEGIRSCIAELRPQPVSKSAAEPPAELLAEPLAVTCWWKRMIRPLPPLPAPDAESSPPLAGQPGAQGGVPPVFGQPGARVVIPSVSRLGVPGQPRALGGVLPVSRSGVRGKNITLKQPPPPPLLAPLGDLKPTPTPTMAEVSGALGEAAVALSRDPDPSTVLTLK
jgi:hypothetical protein